MGRGEPRRPVAARRRRPYHGPAPAYPGGVMTPAIKPRERSAILDSLRAGVVPRIGLHHLQVGCKDEVAAVLRDLDRIADGAATVRFIIGRYGAGKSFFLSLARMVAL